MFQKKGGAMKWKSCVMVIAGAIALSSCTDKNGKYLYVDCYGIMHTRKTCSELKGFVVKGRHIPASVMYADLSYFYPAGNIDYCKECFDDAQYEHTEAIFERNRPIYEKVKGLYEAMRADGIDFGEYSDEDFFDTYGYRFFLSGEEGYQIRRIVYDNLRAIDAISSPTYEEFLRRLGFPLPNQEASAEDALKASKQPAKKKYILDNNKLKQIWDVLRSGGYTQDYKTFVKGFSGDSNYENRKKVYDLLTENGVQVGKDYGEFMQKMHTDTSNLE